MYQTEHYYYLQIPQLEANMDIDFTKCPKIQMNRNIHSSLSPYPSETAKIIS